MRPDLLQRASQFIAGFEGFRSLPYRDSGGVLTIGYGETDPSFIAAHTQGVSQADALAQLEKRVDGFADAVAFCDPGMNDNEWVATTSLAYNIGTGAFAGSSVARLIRAGNKSAAADAFLLWNRAGGVVLQGLVNRRNAERALFLTPVQGAMTVPPDITTSAPLVSVFEFDHPTLGRCGAALTADGAIYAAPGNAYMGAANGKNYFAGRKAVHGESCPGGYKIRSENGSWYGCDGQGNFTGFGA